MSVSKWSVEINNKEYDIVASSAPGKVYSVQVLVNGAVVAEGNAKYRGTMIVRIPFEIDGEKLIYVG